MAKLIRVEGMAGAHIYSGIDSTEQAKELYLDDFGEKATRVDQFSFDQCSWLELRNFASAGDADA